MSGACFFVTDLHGKKSCYKRLETAILNEQPQALFLGGDLLPSGTAALFSALAAEQDFINDFLIPFFTHLRDRLGDRYPRVFVIMGNDDGRIEEADIIDAAATGIWEYVHNHCAIFGELQVYGYAYVPPTPFMLKDWERYDVSRYVDPGCVSPEEGSRSVPVSEHEQRFTTIQKDLQLLANDDDLSKAIMLFHSPPYQTNLDRAALDGKIVDHVKLDPHIGSIAIRRFIESRQPLITLHGHVHESTRLTGSWQQQLGRTYCFSAAHDGPELALVRFNPDNPATATRELL
jgi:Icc-related predicted phosphoesterase